ncbi:MAG: hypothetical protein R6U93_07205 [Dehalococcoidia bacterium]
MTVRYRVQYHGQNKPEDSSEDGCDGLSDPYLREAFTVPFLWSFHVYAALAISSEDSLPLRTDLLLAQN